MFAYLKFFFLASLILIAAAATFFTMLYKNSLHEILTKQTIENNSSIMTGLENAIYQKHKETIEVLQLKDPEDPMKYLIPANKRSDYKEYRKIFSDTGNYFNQMSVIAAGFYTPNQELLFSYPYKDGESLNIAKNIREKRIYGLVESIDFQNAQNEIIENVEYLDKNGQRKFGSVIHSIKPVFDKDNNSVGAIEVFVGMSDATEALNSLQYLGSIFIITVFTVLLAALYWIVRRAEKIISKQYDVNMELQSAKVAAESENEQKSQFLANISHELRTPLNAIIGFSEIMKDEILGALPNDQYKNYILDIHSQGVHLLSLINDILDFSKAEAGKLELEYEELDLNKLIKTALRTQEPRAQTAQVSLLDNLPSKHIVMQTDAKRLKQVLLNLLSNAVKFTPPDGKVTIAAWETATDKNICIEVVDTGIGIAAKDIAKALAPFGQVDSELSRRYEGTGLGLPLTKKFIELLGGTMNLESEVGVGTKITVILPKGATMPDEPTTTNKGIESTSDNFESFQKPKMYVAENPDEKFEIKN